jgi:hypothetical protein
VLRYGTLEAGLRGPPAHPRRIPVTGVRRFGVRAANDVGRCASRGSTAARIVGAPHLTPSSNVAIDDALDEQGALKIIADSGAGISFYFCMRQRECSGDSMALASIRGHSATRDSAGPESRQARRVCFWIPGSLAARPPRNDGERAVQRALLPVPCERSAWLAQNQ